MFYIFMSYEAVNSYKLVLLADASERNPDP